MIPANGYVSGMGVGGLPGQASSAGNGGNGLILMTAFAPCAAGSYFSTSNASCHLCPAGTFAPLSGSVSSCSPCVGYATSSVGATVCSNPIIGTPFAAAKVLIEAHRFVRPSIRFPPSIFSCQQIFQHLFLYLFFLPSPPLPSFPLPLLQTRRCVHREEQGGRLGHVELDARQRCLRRKENTGRFRERCDHFVRYLKRVCFSYTSLNTHTHTHTHSLTVSMLSHPLLCSCFFTHFPSDLTFMQCVQVDGPPGADGNPSKLEYRVWNPFR